MSQDSVKKPSGERSPRAPSDPLAKCVEFIEKIFSEVGRAVVPAETLAKALGYSSLSGASRSTLASLSYYGLLERVGNNHKVSDLALRIIRPISPVDKSLALRAASQEPTAFAIIFQDHADCSESVLSSILLHKGYTEDGAKRTARIFKDNLEYVRQFGEPLAESKTPEPPKPTTPGLGGFGPQFNRAVNTALANELPVPIGENMVARVPFPMSEEDFDLFIGTLNLWKKRLVKKSDAEAIAATNRQIEEAAKRLAD